MTTIVLVDDHPMVRQGLRAVLEAEPGWRVMGEASEGTAALQLIGDSQPDVLILDVMLPGVNGIEMMEQVRACSNQTRIIIFSMHANDAYVQAALGNGAMAYVLKESDGSELLHAIREVMHGRRYLSPTLVERAIDIYLKHASDETLDWSDMLTGRERQVLQFAAQGFTNTEIGGFLKISPRTAETHRTNLMRKLGLRSQAELLRYAMSYGLIPPEDNTP